MIRGARIRTTREGAWLHAHVTPGPPPADATTTPLRPVRTTTSASELYFAMAVHSDDELVLNEIWAAMVAYLHQQAAGRATVRHETKFLGPIRTTTVEGAA